jgi:tetratricopeptide (TPR) repeat protein
MRRNVNVRFLAWVLAIGAVLTVTTIVVHEFQMEHNVAALLDRAAQAEAHNDPQLAASYYLQYLGYHPEDTDTLVRCGRTLAKITDNPDAQSQAFLYLDQATRRRSSDNKLRRETLNLALELYRFAEASEHLQALLKAFPHEAGLWQRQGWCLDGLGDYEKAEASLRKAIQLDPGLLGAYADLANLLLLRLDRPREVLRVLDRMVEANPRSYQALLGRAKYLEATGSAEDAWIDLNRAYALQPHETAVLLAKARLEQKRGDLDQARRTLEAALHEHPREITFYKSLAWLEVKAKRMGEAVRWLRRGLKQAQGSPELLLSLADLLVENGSVVEASQAIAQLRKDYPAPAVADCLQARLWMAQGQWVKAIAALEKIRPRLQKTPEWVAYVDYLLGRGHAQLGDYELAQALLERALRQAPAWTAPRFALGSVFLAVGRIHEAIGELQRIRGAEDAPPQALVLLGQALVLKNRALPPDQQDWGEVARVVEQAAQQDADAPQLLVLQADLHAERKEWDQAGRLLHKALARHPGQQALQIGLADLARREGDFDQARTFLEQAGNDSLSLRLAWIRWYAGQPGATARSGLVALEKDAQRLAPDEQLRLLRELAVAHFSLGNLTEAARLWQDISRRNVRDLQSRFRLLELALHRKDEQGARAALKELRRVEGDDGALWHYGEAAFVATFTAHDPRRLEEARQHVAAVKRRQPHWGRLALLEGWIDEQAGRPEQAIVHYLRALQKVEGPPAVVARLARLLYERRRYVEADMILRKLQERTPLSKELAELAVECALFGRAPERAAQVARQMVPDDARDYRDHLWLAQVLIRAGEPAEAETVLRRLVQRSPAVPDVWVALVEHLIRMGRKGQAEVIIEQASSQLPRDRRYWALGRCYEALGEQSAAEEWFLKDIESRPGAFLAWRHLAEFYLRQQDYAAAEKWLRKVIHPANQVPSELVIRARRQLALALARQDDEPKFHEALRLVQPHTGSSGGAWEENVTRALVLATRASSREEALKLLKVARLQKALAPDVELILGQLYQARGDYDNAFETFQKLVLQEGERPIYLVPYIRGLIERRELNTAAHYLERLAVQVPGHPDLARLRAQLKKAQQELNPQSS